MLNFSDQVQNIAEVSITLISTDEVQERWSQNVSSMATGISFYIQSLNNKLHCLFRVFAFKKFVKFEPGNTFVVQRFILLVCNNHEQ